MAPSNPTTDSSVSSPTIVIVGAGFGGIAGAIELRRHGFQDITILEGAPDLGGTWFYNSYPGAACDVPSHLYSFSYEQRTSWSRLCSPQREILDYLRGVADEYGITPLIRFSQRVADCTFDPGSERWTVQTESGERHDADVLILATGQLNRPSIPGLPGLDRFAGHSFHSARWDHDYDLRGKRVAVVGTGASAVQFVPEVAGQAARLSVFQRTGNWFLPRRNHVYGTLVRGAIRRVPGLQRLRRGFLFNYCESLTLAIRHPRTIGRLAGLRSAAFMRSQLPDPRAARPRLAQLHLRLQTRPVQLPLPPHPRETQRRARHRSDHRGHRNRTAHRRRARPRDRLHHLGDGLQGDGVRRSDPRGGRRRAHA